MARSLFLISLITGVSADLRFASWAKDSYKLRQDNNAGGVNFVNSDNDIIKKYCEPSTFEYQGLSGGGGQKRNNYDQFLRSNIDNEQDNRNFNVDEGEDHMPFRTFASRDCKQENAVDLNVWANEGQDFIIPLRWNNPHSAEVEVNVWLDRSRGRGTGRRNRLQPMNEDRVPIVVPLAVPCCGGEGYQNNVIRAKVQTVFNEKLRQTVKGFDGCTPTSLTRCVVQVYAHSVESRMYSYGFPFYVKTANDAPLAPLATNLAQVQMSADYCKDPGLNLNSLARPICRACTDTRFVDIPEAIPQRARLWSDVANHAYQNSDFSPYSGQQHCMISRNLQASAINKMITGNRGELGKASLPEATKNKLNQLQNLENKVYKKYEALANNMINRYGRQMKETGDMKAGQTTQPLANVFRANQVGATSGQRQQTNTYIPSFQLNTALIAEAKQRLPDKYKDLINEQGEVQIYVSAYNALKPVFDDAAKDFGITYQPNQEKYSFNTMEDPTQFKKRDADGKTDGGNYAGTQNRLETITIKTNGGCTADCILNNNAGTAAPLVKGSTATNTQGACAPCAALFQSELPPNAVTDPPTAIADQIIADPVGQLPDTPGVDPVEDYPDEDGTERVGRPPSPPTTTKKIWYEPGPWMTGGGAGGGGVGVVGGSMRASWDVFLLGFMALVAIMRC